MTETSTNAFAEACAELVGQVAANPLLAEAIVAALRGGELTPSSGPVGIGQVMKGAPGSHHLKEFLKAWGSHAPHLESGDVTATVMASFSSYRLAQGRAHTVDTVWTGPEVSGSEVRRTEAVVSEIIAGATEELLIVGYWLVTSTAQVQTLLEMLIQKAQSGLRVRFVFDPGDKSTGFDNFSALSARWPYGLEGAGREVYSWNESLVRITSKGGQEYDRKLHAKVIVGDRRDALVTSANLTHAGLLENLEMGLRIQGKMAGAIVNHFDLLIEEEVLQKRE